MRRYLLSPKIIPTFCFMGIVLALQISCDNRGEHNATSPEKKTPRRLWLKFQEDIPGRLKTVLQAEEQWDELSLVGSPVEDSLIRSLPVRTDIKILDLSQTLITQEAIDLIPEKFPSLRIIYCDFTAVVSPDPLLRMSKIEEISMYGTLAQDQKTVRDDGKNVYFRYMEIDHKSLKAMQSLTHHNILLYPGFLGASSDERKFLSGLGVPTEFIKIAAWGSASAIANGIQQWDGDPESLETIENIKSPVYLTIDFPQDVKNGKLAYSVKDSDAFFDDCLKAINGCENIVGLSLQNASIEVSQWAEYIDSLDVIISNLRYITRGSELHVSAKLWAEKLDSLLLVQYEKSPDINISISDLLLFPSLKVIYLGGHDLENYETEIGLLAEHIELKILDLPLGILSESYRKKIRSEWYSR